MAMTGGTSILLKTTYPFSDKTKAVKLYLYYKYTQSEANNKTTMYCGMYVTTPTGYDIGSWTDGSGSYVGTTSNTFNGTIPNFSGTRWLTENQTFTVSHDDSGNAKAVIYWKWGVNSPWGSYVRPSGSYTVDLPQIARASTITSVDAATLGSKTKVKWTPKSTSFYYKVKLSNSSKSWTSSAIYPKSTAAYTYTTSELDYAFANSFGEANKSGTITATLYTYSDSACTKQVGSADTETFTATIPDNSSTQPTVTMSVAPVNESGKAWEKLYVQGISKVKATLSATAKYGAKVSSYKMGVDGKNYSSPYESGALSEDGTVVVTGYATDSRSITGKVTKDISVVPYSKPTILHHSAEKEIVCARCDNNGNLSDSGTYLRIKAMRSYAKITSGGNQHNYCQLQYRWKKGETGTYSGWTTLLDKSDTSTDLVDTKLSDVCTDVQSSYFVQLRAIDDVGKYTINTYPIPTDKVDFQLAEGGGGAAFGKYAEKPNTLEIAEDWEIKVYGNRWKSLGLSSGISEGSKGLGNLGSGCYYRVENGNHVYVFFNCSFTYSGSIVTISNSTLPAEYRPTNHVYATNATDGRVIARSVVTAEGEVKVDMIQILSSADATTSRDVSWIYGYIDYFI